MCTFTRSSITQAELVRAAQVAEQLALPKEELSLSDGFVAVAKADLASLVPAGHKLGKPAHLFRTIDKAEEDALRARYSGTQADRQSSAAGAPPEPPAKAPSKKGGKPGGGGWDKQSGKEGGGGKKGVEGSSGNVDGAKKGGKAKEKSGNGKPGDGDEKAGG